MNNFIAVLLRGLLAGAIAGLLAGAVGFALGEPRIDAAIAIEESHAAAQAADGHSHDDEELVSRPGQRRGLFLATTLFGLATGGIYATVFALRRRRSGEGQPSHTALKLAGAAFVGVVLVPFLKYPANPPAVGNPDTIDQRTIAYLLAVALGVLAIWGAVAAARAVGPRYGSVGRYAVGTGSFLLTVGVAFAVLPTFNEVPADFPATLLWQFRVASLAVQATLWTALGFGFAALTEQAARRATAPQAIPAAAH